MSRRDRKFFTHVFLIIYAPQQYECKKLGRISINKCSSDFSSRERKNRLLYPKNKNSGVTSPFVIVGNGI